MMADCYNRKCFQRRADLDYDKYPDKNITYFHLWCIYVESVVRLSLSVTYFDRKVIATFLGIHQIWKGKSEERLILVGIPNLSRDLIQFRHRFSICLIWQKRIK